MLRSQSSLIALSLVFALNACQRHQSQENSQLQVASGKKVLASEALAASIVAIGTQGSTLQNFSPFCTGVLIRPQVVLTAAHCLDGVTGEVSIGFGTDMKAPSEIREAYGLRHESYDAPYNERFSFDLALLKIKGPVPTTARWMPRMAAGELKLADKLWIAGFGVSSEGVENSGLQNTALYKAALSVTRIFDPDQEEDMSEYGLFVTETTDSKAQVCEGDSGAPVFKSTAEGLKLAGIAVGGYGTCNRNSYQTNVAFYQEWIDKTLAGLETQAFPRSFENRELPQLQEDPQFLVSYRPIRADELAKRKQNPAALVTLELDPRKGEVLVGADPWEADAMVSGSISVPDAVGIRRYRTIYVAHIESQEQYVAYATFLDEDDGGNTLGWIENLKGARVARIADSFLYEISR